VTRKRSDRERAFLLVSGARTEREAAERAARREQAPRHPPRWDRRSAGRAVGITQGQVARLADVSRYWYGALEAGRPGNYSDACLHAVRWVLDLRDEEWKIVCRVTRGHGPAAAPVSQLGPLLPDTFRAFVEESRTWAVYLNDRRRGVLAYNAKTVEYFPWMRYGFNVMEWALTWLEACTQLADWDEEWAMPMMARLRVHAAHCRTDERLRAVIETVRADPAARKLWDAPDLPAITHPVSEQPRRPYLTGRVVRNSPSGSSREHLTNFPCAASWVSRPPRLYRVTGDLQRLRLRRAHAPRRS